MARWLRIADVRFVVFLQGLVVLHLMEILGMV